MKWAYSVSTLFQPLLAPDPGFAAGVCPPVSAPILLSMALFTGRQPVVGAGWRAVDTLPPSRCRANEQAVVIKPPLGLF